MDSQRLGVPSFSDEVDAVAGRAGSTAIWLLEVKDREWSFPFHDALRPGNHSGVCGPTFRALALDMLKPAAMLSCWVPGGQRRPPAAATSASQLPRDRLIAVSVQNRYRHAP